MRQHIIHDPTTADYAGGLELVWNQWDPALRKVETKLAAGAHTFADDEQSIDVLRRAQYRAHTAYEFASGLRPPVAAGDANEYLMAALAACRDTLGALAMQGELGELDDQMLEVGMHALATTRDAFGNARYSSAAAYQFTETLDPIYQPAPRAPAKGVGIAIWGLVLACSVLLTVLLFELFLLTPA